MPYSIGDLAGAMNIISLAKTAFNNPSVLQLIEEEQKAKLKENKKKQLGGKRK